MVGRPRRVWLARAFLAVTLVWLVMLVAVPYLQAHQVGGHRVIALSAGTYLVGSAICHQRPERSFRLWGVQMPVCARCAGLYLGAAVGVVLVGAGRVGPDATRAVTPALRWMMLVAAVPTAATLVAETLGWLPSATGWLRAVAAVPLGAAVTWVASLVIRGEIV